LQLWYTLSDEALEDALCDRLPFRRFVGLGLEEAIPDASTLCSFRCDRAAHDPVEALFAAVGRSLDSSGLLVRQGTLIDASLIAAAAAEPRRQPGGGVSRVGPEAEWVKKGSKTTFGYKLHIAVDQSSGLVRAARFTTARVANCTIGPDLVQGDEVAVFADMGYDSTTIRDRLDQAGIANAVMKRPNR
jgi:IS5 family transposase